MKKRLQIAVSDEAWNKLENITNAANDGFTAGSINYSDLVSEMILQSDLDIKALQKKHINFRKWLRHIASRKDISAASLNEELLVMLPKSNRKTSVGSPQSEGQ